MDIATIFFYIISALIVFSAISVVVNPNPVYSALNLALTMIGLAFIYYSLKAPFIAGVQLIVYAGAVIILFVIVLMIFDLKTEEEKVEGKFLNIPRSFKMICAGWLCGLIIGAVSYSQKFVSLNKVSENMTDNQGVKELAYKIFTKYLFAFEALGLMLLLIAIGVVAISRAKGGTHAKS